MTNKPDFNKLNSEWQEMIKNIPDVRDQITCLYGIVEMNRQVMMEMFEVVMKLANRSK